MNRREDECGVIETSQLLVCDAEGFADFFVGQM